MKNAQNEIFGSVVSVITCTHHDVVIRNANNPVCGLSGAVCIAGPERAYRMARRMRTGSVAINGVLVDPNMRSAGSSNPASAVRAGSRPEPSILREWLG